MRAPLFSYWPRSRHGPGCDVLGHLGPAFLLTVTSHRPKRKHSIEQGQKAGTQLSPRISSKL